MSDITNIRALIADQAVYVKDEPQTFDPAVSRSLQVVYAPLVARGASGVIITLAGGTALDPLVNPFTVDYENGVVTFTGTPPSLQDLIVEYSHVSLSDATIQTILDINVDGQDPLRLSAADCLDAIASAQAVIEKKIKLLDMETDGAAVAKALRDHAMTLRKLVFDPDFQESAFDFVEQINPPDSAAWWEKISKDWMRTYPL